MSTRSLTHVYEDGKILLTFYRQSDGYPEGHGRELAKFLDGFRIVNGLCGDEGKVANGMPCLAAFLVAHFKDGPGGIYIYPAGASDCSEEYVYRVRVSRPVSMGGNRYGALVEMQCEEADGTQLFSGFPEAFNAWIAAKASE